MKAADAARKSEKVRREQEAERRQLEYEESQRRDRRVKRQVPGLVKKAQAAIRKAVRAGNRSVTLDFGDANYCVSEALQKDGYRTNIGTERTNMGDSAAPCMIDVSYMIVKW